MTSGAGVFLVPARCVVSGALVIGWPLVVIQWREEGCDPCRFGPVQRVTHARERVKGWGGNCGGSYTWLL